MKTYRVWYKTFVDVAADTPEKAKEEAWECVDLETPMGDIVEIEEIEDEESTDPWRASETHSINEWMGRNFGEEVA